MTESGPPPPQKLQYPGRTGEMEPTPRDEMHDYTGRELLTGKRALVTGGDSGIGRAVAIAFAKEGADVSVAYLHEHEDARHTGDLVRQAGGQWVSVAGDLADPDHCRDVVTQTIEGLGGLDILVNNAAYQQPAGSLEELADEQWEHTFAVNVHSYFRVTKAALPHLGENSSIINTSSVNGLRGNPTMIDYAASKGAILAFTYSLARSLVDRGIRVNCIAPGPVWTPLIPATFNEERVSHFGEQAPMGRPAQPDEIAPSYVFMASEQMSSYYTGEVLAPIGGEIMPG